MREITILFLVYHVLVMTITVLNAIVTATISFKVKDLRICINRCRLYMDIMTGKKLLSIKLANIELEYWSVRSSNRREEDGVKMVEGKKRYICPL